MMERGFQKKVLKVGSEKVKKLIAKKAKFN